MKKKMTLEDLVSVLVQLDEYLAAGGISKAKYEKDYQDLLSAAGWTEKELDEAIDKRWEYINPLYDAPEKAKSMLN